MEESKKNTQTVNVCRWCMNSTDCGPGLVYCKIRKRKEFTGGQACEEYIHDEESYEAALNKEVGS